jgi:hypothetical protein
VIVVPEGCMDDAELVGEEAPVAALPLEIAGDAERRTPIVKDAERVTKSCEHHRAARRVSHRLLQGRDGLNATSESLECPPGKKVAPMERGFHADDALRLRQGSTTAF